MSWGEVKKINSDLTTPLNVASLINHIDLVGSTFMGYNVPAVTIELLRSTALHTHTIASAVIGDSLVATPALRTAVIADTKAINQSLGNSVISAKIATLADVLAYTNPKIEAGAGVGTWLAEVCISNNAALKACANIAAVVASAESMAIVAGCGAINIIFGNATAYAAAVASSTAMTAIANSPTAMKTVVNYTAVMTAIEASTPAKNALAASALAVTEGFAVATGQTLRRSGKVYIISHRQTFQTSGTYYDYLYGTTIGNQTLSWLLNATYNLTVTVARFFPNITNSNNMGNDAGTKFIYTYIPCE